MSIELKPIEKKLSITLTEIASHLPEGSLTLRQLLEEIGEQGLLIFCIFLTIPFLIPVSIPGVSTVFGALIILISIGLLTNRLPWLPEKLMQKSIPKDFLNTALEKSAHIFEKIDKFSHARLEQLTQSTTALQFNGFMLLLGGILLIFPFGFVPFSNTLPGLAILLLAVGMLQKDGYFVLAGYIMNILTIIYFTVLIGGAIMAGKELWSLFGG
ncbi:exopolysaccharide biosynthesis protein [Beggiatoa leptomitoformis]|uniref:Exopolysaccharide biosynthesis protein n=1 Tax=Beggiatoa leptomitoformis TaxID=288004 RepID=A0A2N9YHL5_9GAMM|nr:exopolysaccharide biosynthesis protein [Beggiatoa leptomitoformis]ALG67758.1 exopolysaccharide biosynthesis protein [Beggiatoa leptomitoformis]AUI70000.1 exopolysaccharide biosynthesis protein [Beggiatoa leptomitoformis]